MAKFQKNGVQVTGLRKTIRAIEKLGAESEDLKGAFQRIGARALSTVNAGTPVLSGALKASNKQSKRKNSVYLYSGRKRQYYAVFQEYGTLYIEPKRYVYRAVEKDGPWAVTQLDREISQIINRLGLND
jgi:hypothetical protein